MRFIDSAFEHGISEEDSRYAILHHVIRGETTSCTARGRALMFVGHPHPQTERYLEVGVELTYQGELVVFHSMELTDKWSWLLFELREGDE